MHVDSKDSVWLGSASVDHSDVDRPSFTLWQWQGHAYIRIECGRTGPTGRASYPGSKLALKQILNKRVVPFPVALQSFSCHFFIGSASTVL